MIIAESWSSTASDEVSPVLAASAVSVGRMREPRSACSSTAFPTISARSVRRYLPCPTASTQPAATQRLQTLVGRAPSRLGAPCQLADTGGPASEASASSNARHFIAEPSSLGVVAPALTRYTVPTALRGRAVSGTTALADGNLCVLHGNDHEHGRSAHRIGTGAGVA